MDLSQLRYFNAVARHGSFSAAAKALRVTQPGLTKAVRRLEASLDCTLFRRLPRGVALTAAGPRAAAACQPARGSDRGRAQGSARAHRRSFRRAADRGRPVVAQPRAAAHYRRALRAYPKLELPRCRRLQQCPDGGAEQRPARSRRFGAAGPMSRRDCRRSRSPPTPSRSSPGAAIRCAPSAVRSLRARSPILGPARTRRPVALAARSPVSRRWSRTAACQDRSRTRSPSSRRFCATATCCRSRRRRSCAARWAASRRCKFPGLTMTRSAGILFRSTAGHHAGDARVHRGDQAARARAWNELRAIPTRRRRRASGPRGCRTGGSG